MTVILKPAPAAGRVGRLFHPTTGWVSGRRSWPPSRAPSWAARTVRRRQCPGRSGIQRCAFSLVVVCVVHANRAANCASSMRLLRWARGSDAEWGQLPAAARARVSRGHYRWPSRPPRPSLMRNGVGLLGETISSRSSMRAARMSLLLGMICGRNRPLARPVVDYRTDLRMMRHDRVPWFFPTLFDFGFGTCLTSRFIN